MQIFPTFLNDTSIDGFDFVVIGTCVLLILLSFFFALSLAHSRKKDEAFEKAVKEKAQKQHVFKVDMKDESVSTFNVSDSRTMETIPLSMFLSRLPDEDGKRLMAWFKDILDENVQAPNVLEFSEYSEVSKSYLVIVNKLDKADREKGIIHYSTHVQPNEVTVSSQRGRLLRHRHALINAIAAARWKSSYLICVRLVDSKAIVQGSPVNAFILSRAKNSLAPMLKSKRYIFQGEDGCLFAASLNRPTNADDPNPTIRQTIARIKSDLATLGVLEDTEIYVGGVRCHDMSYDAESIIKQANKMAAVAYETGVEGEVVWYEKGTRNEVLKREESVRSEVQRIIKGRKLDFGYRCIYDYSNGRVSGFLSKAVPDDQYFADVDELKDYAFKSDDSKELFMAIGNGIVPKFIAECPEENTLLYIPIRFYERDYVHILISSFNAMKPERYVLLLSERELEEAIEFGENQAFLSQVREIKAEGFKLGLNADADGINLPPEAYACFDEFIVGLGGETPLTPLDRTKQVIRDKANALIKYGKPLSFDGVKDWDSVELLLDSGLTLLSGDVLSPYSEMLTPPSPKALKKIEGMKG